MSASLTLILPVHNGQNWLRGKTQMALDELSQLTAQFEVVIVDDGSTDDTHSIASELAAQYPQVKLLRQSLRYGFDTAEKRGIEVAVGQFIIVPDDSAALQGCDLHRLWRVRHDPTLVMVVNQATPESPTSTPAYRIDDPSRRVTRAHASGSRGQSLRMMRRDVVDQVGRPRSPIYDAPLAVGSIR